MSAEMDIGLRMGQTVTESMARILEALLDALGDNAKNVRDRDTLRDFSAYVQQGGRMRTISVTSTAAAEAFEQALKDGGVRAFKSRLAYDQTGQTCQYLFRDADAAKIDQIVIAMKRDGINIVQTSSTDYAALADRLEREGQKMGAIFPSPGRADEIALRLDELHVEYAELVRGDEAALFIPGEAAAELRKVPWLADEDITDDVQSREDKKLAMADVQAAVKRMREDAERQRAAKQADRKQRGSGRFRE